MSARILAENRSLPGHTSDCNKHQKMDRYSMPPKKRGRGGLRRKRAMKGHVPLRPACSIELPTARSNCSWS